MKITLHNLIADIRTYLRIIDMPVLDESQFMLDDKTRVHVFKLLKQAIIVSCHGAGTTDDIFKYYDMTIQVTKI